MRARRLLMTSAVLCVAALVWFFVFGPGQRGARPPSTYGIHEAHPGDLQAHLKVSDNVRNYGLPQDLPYHFTTTELGFRGPAPHSGDAPKVLVLGDSFVFGMGVDDAAAFPHQLQLALHAGGIQGASVYNGGVPGYTITDVNEQWDEKLRRFDADWVLLCHNGSDLKEMARPYSLRRLMRYDAVNPARDDAEIRALVDASPSREEAIRTHFIYPEAALWERLGEDAAAVEALRARYVEGVLALHQKVVESGARFAVVLWVRRYTLAGLDVAPVRDTLTRAGIHVFEGEAEMHRQTAIPPGRLYLPDRHFSTDGNALAAEQTAEWLRAQML